MGVRRAIGDTASGFGTTGVPVDAQWTAMPAQQFADLDRAGRAATDYSDAQRLIRTRCLQRQRVRKIVG